MKTSTLAAIAAATFVGATSATLPVFASDWTDAKEIAKLLAMVP